MPTDNDLHEFERLADRLMESTLVHFKHMVMVEGSGKIQADIVTGCHGGNAERFTFSEEYSSLFFHLMEHGEMFSKLALDIIDFELLI